MRKALPQICAAGFAGMVLLAVILFLPQRAQAHAQLVKSIPQDKAVLDNAPTQVDLWFDELLDKEFNKVEVYRASEIRAAKHRNLGKGDVQVDPKDRTHLILQLQPLPPGDYVVDWSVLSRDGHSSLGRFTFRVKAG